jgi:hypothetical protein
MLHMCNTRQTCDLPIYAAHRDGTRWSILAPCDDPHGPAWRVVDTFDEPPEGGGAWAIRRLAEIVGRTGAPDASGSRREQMRLKGCWSCGSHGECYDGCDCAKCLDPEGYAEWRANNPDEYAEWLESQRLEHDEGCDCPGCV